MLCVNDFEEYAKNHLYRPTWEFYSQGAEKEESVRENIDSFKRYYLIPRMLRNGPQRDLSVKVMGETLPVPFGIAPTAFQKMAHPDGEIAAAKAASEMGSIYTLSTLSTTSLEDVADAVAGGSTPLWMQVFFIKERKFTEEMVRKAEKSGFKALVLTVDSPDTGLQLKKYRYPLVLPPHVGLPNVGSAISRSVSKKNSYSDAFYSTLTWDDVTWLKNFTHLPIVLKGIMTVQDAVQAARIGASAIWISNHGGRQLDGIQSPIDVLTGIKDVLSGTDCEVYVDGGVRWGSDILKALALGANYVFVGRPALWGLTHSGQDGVRKVLEILKSELDRAMLLAGCKNIGDIGPQLVKRKEMSRL